MDAPAPKGMESSKGMESLDKQQRKLENTEKRKQERKEKAQEIQQSMIKGHANLDTKWGPIFMKQSLQNGMIPILLNLKPKKTKKTNTPERGENALCESPNDIEGFIQNPNTTHPFYEMFLKLL